MKIVHVAVAVAVALVAACSSSEEESPAELAGKSGQPEEMKVDDDKQPSKVYRKTEGTGDIEVVAFESSGRYQMQLANATRLDEGTYNFDADNKHVTFRSIGGTERTMEFSDARTTTPEGVKPKTLVQPGGDLAPNQGKTLIGQSSYELLQEAYYFCKQNVSPNAGNCGAQGLCPAGYTMCIKVI